MQHYFVDKHNTPNLKLYTCLIFLAYFFTGVNFIVTAVSNPAGDITVLRACGAMGILFLTLAPVAILDRRKENRGIPAVIGSAAAHGACTVMCAAIFDFAEICVIYLAEIVVSLLCVFFIKRSGKHG